MKITSISGAILRETQQYKLGPGIRNYRGDVIELIAVIAISCPFITFA